MQSTESVEAESDQELEEVLDELGQIDEKAKQAMQRQIRKQSSEVGFIFYLKNITYFLEAREH